MLPTHRQPLRKWPFFLIGRCSGIFSVRPISMLVSRPTLAAGGRDVFVCMCTCMRNHALELLQTSDRTACRDSCSESATITPPSIISSVRGRVWVWVWVCPGDRDRDGEIAEFACSCSRRRMMVWLVWVVCVLGVAACAACAALSHRVHLVRRSRSAIRAAAAASERDDFPPVLAPVHTSTWKP